jgi:hypothetical protein
MVRARSRMLGSLALSAAAHALVVATLALAGRFAWPAAPIPIEMVMPKPRAVQPPPPPAAPPPPPKSERVSAAINKEGIAMRKTAKPSPAPELPAPPATRDLKQFAPEDANLVILLRSEKLRQSPHRENIEKLLSALPDYHTLLGGTGLSPIQDLDALLIATNDPRSVIATFLAARYPDSPRLRGVIGRPLMPGDPRVFRTLKPGLTVLTKPEGAAKLDDALAGRADAGDDPRVSWLKQLEQFDQVARGADGPAFLLTISDVPALLRFGGGLPTPLAMALAVTGDASPSLRLKAVFARPEEAAQLVAAWPQILQRWRSATMLLGLSAALDGLTITQHQADAEILGRISESQLKIGLSWATTLLPSRGRDGGAP